MQPDNPSGASVRDVGVHFSSQRMDWPTPRDLFAQLHAEFNFTLDACASSENACLPRFLTERDEGLVIWRASDSWRAAA